MKRNRARAGLGLGVALTLPFSASAQDVGTPPPAPAPAKAPSEPAGEAQLTPGDEAAAGIDGRLLDLDGKTPLAGKELVLRNAETGDLIARVTTGDEGEFKLPALMNGAYSLEWGGNVQYFELRDDRPLRTLKVLAPTKRAQGLKLTQEVGSTILFVGAGVGIIVLAGVGGGVLGYNLKERSGDGGGGAVVSNGIVFEVSPSGDFGTLGVGQTTERTFVLRNLNATQVQGTLTSTSSQFEVVSGGTFSIAPNGIASVTVRYQPTTVTRHVGTLEATVPGIPTTFKTLHGVGSATAVSPSTP